MAILQVIDRSLVKNFTHRLYLLLSLQRCAVDDDDVSLKVAGEEFKPEEIEGLPRTTTSTGTKAINDNEPINNIINDPQDSMKANAANVEAPVLDTTKPLSCNWSSGVGPRIGCVRDYPADLQSRALEQVNLSPRVDSGHLASCVPIPSPRPSPKIRVSPRLAYMGLPSPRVAVTPAC